MKKILNLFASLLIVSTTFAQKKASPVPVDSITHLITYEEVIQTPNVSADVLYNKALAWFRTYFKSPGEVMLKNDQNEHVIVGKPRFKIYNPADKDGTKSDAGLVQYTITVSAREGRFKYELTEFNWKQNSYYAAEKWMNTKAQSYTAAY